MRALLLALAAVVSASAAEPVSFAKHIQPILADRCQSCHGPDKQKGDLRLDSPAAIRRGGKNGQVLTPGDPEKSPLWKLTTLPKGDEDVMPAKGEPLTPAQQALLRQWIAEGAKIDGEAVAAAAATRHPPSQADLGQSDLDVLTANVAAPDAATLKALTDAGALVAAVSQKGAALDIDLSHTREPLGDKHLALLARLAPNVVWLDLRGTPLTDAQLATVARCGNLVRLHLDRTQITGAGLAQLKGCANLAYLNLVSTKVTDASLSALASLPRLKAVYLWQSQVTPAGAEALEKALPQCRVDTGPDFSDLAGGTGDGKKKRKK